VDLRRSVVRDAGGDPLDHGERFAFRLGARARHRTLPRLSVLSFLTPMFGVLCGVVFLSEPLTGTFALAALLVAAGIVLVNLR